MDFNPTPPGIRLAAAPLSDAGRLPSTWLGPLERERAAAYGAGAPRLRFTAGRLLARSLAASLLSVPPEDVGIANDCPLCGPGAHGRPVLLLRGVQVPASFSLTRAAAWILVAVGPPAMRLGVDLAEPADAAFSEGHNRGGLDELSFGAAERAALASLPPRDRPRERARLWALKEALGKALGEGIAGPDGIPSVEGVGAHPALLAPGAVKWSPPSGSAGLPRELVSGAVLLPPSAGPRA